MNSSEYVVKVSNLARKGFARRLRWTCSMRWKALWMR